MSTASRRLDRSWAIFALLAAVASAGARSAEPGDRLSLQGLVDSELWSTEGGSRLLERNDDEPAALGRLRLWAAADIARGLEGFALGQLEGGKAYEDGQTEVELDQAFLRYRFPRGSHMMLEAGKVAVPFGNFSTRYLSSVNPLIDGPDSYDVSYPVGAVLSGKFSKLDWKAAIMDRPIVNENYVPRWDRALRPGVTLGVTPAIGIRVAAYYTRGPYLGSDVEPMLPDGAGWRDFDEEITGVELALSRGYFELNGDLAFSSYELPAREGPARGTAWFVEPKYTWTPRFFTALRLERSDYPTIMPINAYYWPSDGAAFDGVEAGAGWRFTPDLVLKAAYRADRWDVDEERRDSFPNGSSVALQLSYEFDVISWFDRPE